MGLIQKAVPGYVGDVLKGLGSILDVAEWLQSVVPAPTEEEIKAAVSADAPAQAVDAPPVSA